MPAAELTVAYQDGPAWPVRSGAVPVLADGFSSRPETAPALGASLVPGTVVALVPARPAGAPGPDWLRASGKTQLAAAYAESLWQARSVDLLVWITATSRASVLSGYAAAAAVTMSTGPADGAESVATRFLSWLGETGRPWLVVLDDLSGSAGVGGLWPAGRPAGCWSTTADAMAVPAQTLTLPVGPFSSREALSYLLGRLTADPDQRLGAIDLVQDLGCEPAALAQASAVIATSTLSCRDYRDYYARRREQLTQPGGLPPAAAVTWTFSFEQADQLSPDGSARSLLALAALLDGHDIPAAVLASPAACRYLDGEGGGPAAAGRARAALAALERTGLLTIGPAAAPAVRLSPVLQEALRAVMPEDMLTAAISAAADALTESWPDAQPQGGLAASLRSCATALQRVAADRLWSGGCHPVLVQTGRSLDGARLTGPAVSFWRDLATTGDRLLGAGHPDTLLAGQHLAGAYLAAGHPADSVPWFQWVLDSQIHKLGQDHHSVIEARRRLGHALIAAGQIQDAIAVLNRAVGDYEHLCGPGHLDTLGARDELAAAHLATGQHPEAITLYRRTLAERERIQGAQHPQTMTTRQCLADSYHAGGRGKDAVSAYKRVLADRERALGPDHPDTLKTRSNLGAAFHSAGKMTSAVQAFEQAQAGYERVMGAGHPDSLHSSARLAQAYYQAGRLGDARTVLRETIERCDRTLPPDDPLRRQLRSMLASVGN